MTRHDELIASHYALGFDLLALQTGQGFILKRIPALASQRKLAFGTHEHKTLVLALGPLENRLFADKTLQFHNLETHR